MQTKIQYTIKMCVTKLIVLLLAVLCSQVSFAAESDSSLINNDDQSDYSKGLQSYLDGDYESSQIHWLNAAKQNDAKSMFNIGLLHEQGKIAGAELEKAENWFSLAGKHGYAAADYHYAKFKMSSASQGESEMGVVRTLLKRAADNNYAPAKELLRSLAGINSGRDSNVIISDKNQNTYLTEDFIIKKQSSNWTIQILAFEQKGKVHAFIDRHQLNSTAAYFTEKTQESVLYKLIYGSYQTKEDAEKARDSLTPELKEHGPWLRSMASVQTLIKAN